MSLEKLRHSKSSRSRGKPVYCLSWLAGNYGCLIFSRLGTAPWGMATGSLAGHRAAREGAGHRARPPRSDLPASAPGRRRGNWRSVPISPPHPPAARVPSLGQWNPGQGGCRGLRPRPRGSTSLLHQAAPHSESGKVEPTLPQRTERSSLVLQLSP